MRVSDGALTETYERYPGAGCAPLPAGYRRREPEKTALHAVVREHLASFVARAREESEHGRGLPRFVEQELARYLDCGILARGFARVRCGGCGHELLVAFSCKGRGVCPSCGARRMHDTAAHLVDRVLPRAPYRQWVLSVPRRVRYLLAGDPGLSSLVLRILLRAVFAWQRRRAKALEVEDGRPGAVTFVQRFGSSLNLHLHYHCIVPEGVFTEGPDGAPVFHDVPAPDDDDVLAILRKVVVRVHKLLEHRGALDEVPAGALARVHAESAQAGLLPPPAEPEEPPPGRRAAFLEGYSLHAGTFVHETDRAGLERLARYGARPPFALERLSQLERRPALLPGQAQGQRRRGRARRMRWRCSRSSPR